VFGTPIANEADSEGVSKVNASQPVWLLAFCCGAVANLLYPAYLLQSKGTWYRYVCSYADAEVNCAVQLPNLEEATGYKMLEASVDSKVINTIFQLLHRVVLTFCMAAVWMSHIVIYGYSQSLLGNLGAGIAWPLIMITTVLTGQMWSIFLGEWVGMVPTALHWNVASVFSLLIGVAVIALGNSL